MTARTSSARQARRLAGVTIQPLGQRRLHERAWRRRHKRIEFPVHGKDVWRTVTVYEGGKVIHRTTYSHYSRITGVTQVER